MKTVEPMIAHGPLKLPSTFLASLRNGDPYSPPQRQDSETALPRADRQTVTTASPDRYESRRPVRDRRIKQLGGSCHKPPAGATGLRLHCFASPHSLQAVWVFCFPFEDVDVPVDEGGWKGLEGITEPGEGGGVQ